MAMWSLPTAFDVPMISPAVDIKPTRDPASLELMCRHKVHQSTIKSMAIVSTCSDVIIFTGGDDNALALTRIENSLDDSAQFTFSTLLVPSAHASAINTLQILNENIHLDEIEGLPDQSILSLITTGNDQRIKHWSVTLELGEPGVAGIHLKRVFNNSSSVADASCMALISGHTTGAVAIAGVGIEVWTA